MEGRPELKEVGPLNRVSYHPGIIKIARGIKKFDFNIFLKAAQTQAQQMDFSWIGEEQCCRCLAIDKADLRGIRAQFPIGGICQ